MTALAPAVAADTVIASDDFSQPLSSSWQQSGNPTLSTVDVGDDPALQVANRAQDFDGIETAPGVLQPGATYTVTAQVRVADGTVGTPDVRWVQNYSVGGNAQFVWVPDSNRSASADSWTTIDGTFTIPANATAPKIYLGTANLAGPYTYLVDDLVLTRAPEAPVVTPIASDDFSQPLSESWQQSGDPTLSIVDIDGDPALRVGDRDQDFDGIETAPGVLVAGNTYEVGMRVRLEEGTTGTRDVRFVTKPGFQWVPNTNTPVSADGWTTIEGTFTVPADADQPSVYIGTADSTPAAAYAYLVDDLFLNQIGGDGPTDPGPTDPGTPGEQVAAMTTSFEDGLDGWILRRSSNLDVAPTVDVTTEFARTGAQSAVVADRGNQGDGIGFNVVDVLLPGITYEIVAWVRFAPNQPAGDIWVTLQADSAFQTIAQNTGLSNGEFRQVTATLTMPPNALSTGLLYFETAYVAPPATGNITTFYIDDITVTQAEELTVADVLPITNTTDFPVGVAIDSRETGGAQAGTVTRHFDQVTAENSMKPEAFYNNNRQFVAPSDATQVMNFARDNDLRVWGHTLVWHAQTPAWFFQTADGQPLSTSDADKQILRDRMRDHIFRVAELYATQYGPYGGGNPIVAWDVVNEVITDSNTTDDGLRRSEWYRILGEEFIDLAFRYADEAFNDVYAAEGADRPVTLFINDYNTELRPKGTRMLALLERLIDRGVPVDGVGHQMHVSLSFPVQDLGATLERFEPLGLQQAVTELDVTTGTPESEALFIDQGLFYQEAFNDFRAFHDRTGQLYSATVWGLSDNRSWRSDRGGPLLFDARLQPKPAYFGVVNGELPAPLRTANVFGATVTEVDDRQWQRMPDIRIDNTASFQVRWANDQLYVLVEVEDATPNAGDAVELQLGSQTVTVSRADAQRDTADGWATVATLPLGGAGLGDLVDFDARVIDNGWLRSGWNAAGVLGTLTLLEPLGFLEVVEAEVAPTIDGTIDEVWESATVVETGKQVEGSSGASATVRTLWRGDELYVLMEVADPVIDVSGSDPWIQDSVEIYVDAGNFKNGPYRFDDTQIRINAENVVSFGAGGDEGFQASRLQSATSIVDGGYIVEASINLLSYSGLGTVHGLDFQVNDAQNGARQSIRNWADPSGAGFQSTARWGVGQLVAEAGVDPTDPTDPTTPRIELGSPTVEQGGTIPIELSGLTPGAEVDIVLVPAGFTFIGQMLGQLQVPAFAAATAFVAADVEFPLLLGSFIADENGEVSGSVTIPGEVPPGDYRLLALIDGVEVASVDLTVTAADADGGDGTGGGGGTDGAGGSDDDTAGGAGSLPTTGAVALSWVLLLALVLMAVGAFVRTTLIRRVA
ncbi:endo-1,4-beta-xylanase [Microcella sp.]|uniref:endo-1,4-beta-xylanase n=1 Tax=Microcella sp. TaxID=1913979 RepID=UPI00391AE9B1